jgi:hypothetical protein
LGHRLLLGKEVEVQLSSLLEKLTGLFTPAFLISSVTPLFCFILVNAAILGQFNHTVSAWVQSYFLLGIAPKTVIAAIVSITLLVIAYVFSTLNLSLRQILEGEYLPTSVASRLRDSETARLNALLKEFRGFQKTRWQLSRQWRSWLEELQEARGKGIALNTCNYPENSDVHASLANLEEMRWRGDLITAETVQNQVDLLKNSLTTNSAELRDSQDSRRLDRDHRLIVDLIGYARQRAEEDNIELFNKREFNFSRFKVAPTRMGNIAESINSYAQSRYGMNLVFFWARLQKVLQGKSEFYKTLQDAKTQLDFAVSLFWLTVGSTVLWLFVLPFVSRTWLPLIGVWAVGPVLARIWYLLAIQNYRSFADLVRSSLDLFRFEVLTQLKIPLPPDSDAEPRLWDNLNRRFGYNEENVLIAYKHD